MIGKLKFGNESSDGNKNWYIISASGFWRLHSSDVSYYELEKIINGDWWDGRFVDFEVVLGCEPSECDCHEKVDSKRGKDCKNSVKLAKIMNDQPDLNSMPLANCLDNFMTMNSISRKNFIP